MKFRMQKFWPLFALKSTYQWDKVAHRNHFIILECSEEQEEGASDVISRSSWLRLILFFLIIFLISGCTIVVMVSKSLTKSLFSTFVMIQVDSIDAWPNFNASNADLNSSISTQPDFEWISTRKFTVIWLRGDAFLGLIAYVSWEMPASFIRFCH